MRTSKPDCLVPYTISLSHANMAKNKILRMHIRLHNSSYSRLPACHFIEYNLRNSLYQLNNWDTENSVNPVRVILTTITGGNHIISTADKKEI